MNDKREKTGKVFRAVSIAMIPGIVFLAVFSVGRQLWMDDTHSTFHAFEGVGGVIESLRTDSHPPLYFMFLSLWMKLGGLGEIWLRIPSILFTLAGGWVLFRFGRDGGDPRLPWMYALLFLFNPIVVWHMHTVRPYALVGLIAAVNTTLFIRLASRKDPDRKGLVLFVFFNALGTLTLYWFFLLLLAEAIGAALFLRRRARYGLILSLIASGIPFAILWAPIFFEQLKGSPTSWMAVPGWAWSLRAPLDLVGGVFPFGFPIMAIGFYLLFGVALMTGIRPLSKVGRRRALREFLEDRRVLLLLTIPLMVMVLALAWSQMRPVYHPKYTIVVSPALAILLGSALAQLGDRLLAALVCAFFLTSSVIGRDFGLRLERSRDNRAVTRYVVENFRNGDELVSVSLGYAPTVHYLRALAPGRSFPHEVFPAEIAHHPGWRDQRRLLADTLSLRREARELVEDLAAREDLERVWFMPDLELDRPLSQVLMEELEDTFLIERVIPLEGWWVSEIQLYVPEPAEGLSGDSPSG